MAEEQTPSQEATAPKKKSPMKLIIMVVVALAIIGGGALGAMKFLGGGGEEEAAEESEVAEGPTFGTVIELDEFTVNLNDDAGQRYLRVRIGLELADDTLRDQIAQRTPLIRDAILLLLSSLDLSDISSVEGKDQLKEEIIDRIEEFLYEGAITRVLFAEFLVQ